MLCNEWLHSPTGISCAPYFKWGGRKPEVNVKLVRFFFFSLAVFMSSL